MLEKTEFTVEQFSSILRFNKRTVQKWAKKGNVTAVDIDDGRERVLSCLSWDAKRQRWLIDIDMTRYARKLNWVFQCDGTRYVKLQNRDRVYNVHTGKIGDIGIKQSQNHLLNQIFFDFWGTKNFDRLVDLREKNGQHKLSDVKMIMY